MLIFGSYQYLLHELNGRDIKVDFGEKVVKSS